MCQTQGSRLVCVARSPSAKCVVCQPQGCTVRVAQLGNNQRYNSVGCRFQSRNPTARSQEQRDRMAACRIRIRTLNTTTNRPQGRKVGRDGGGRKVGCSQGWQGVRRKVERFDWMFARSQGRTQEAIATEGRHPTFVVVLRLTLHPHAEQSSIGLHRGVYHVATTAITTLLRSLRVLAFLRSYCHHSSLSVATGATLSPLRGNHSSLSVSTGATLSPLRGCVSALRHTLRSPLLLRSLRPPSLLVLVLQRLAFSPLCSPGKCSFVTSCQGCIESAGAASLSSSA